MRAIILKFQKVYQSFSKHNMSVYASSASFFIILAVFPAIMILLNLIQMTPLSPDDLVETLNSFVPEAISPLLGTIIDELYSKSSGTILSMSVLAALWSASKGVLGVERGLNHIFETEENRGYFILRLISAVYTMVFIIVMVFVLGLLVFGNRIQIMLENRFPVLSQFTGYVISIRTLLSVCILTLFFTCIYKFFPKRKTTLKRQLPGAIFSTFGWMLFSFFFALYVDNFGNFSYMYGSLTTMILLMLWLYTCIYILFLGAEINMLFIHRKKAEK